MLALVRLVGYSGAAGAGQTAGPMVPGAGPAASTMMSLTSQAPDGTTMRLGFVQWPEGLDANGPAWESIAAAVRRAAPEILVTNEMPFGPWIAKTPEYDQKQAVASLTAHDAGLEALKALRVPLILSSRPVRCEDRLANEAFALQDGAYRFLHQKHYFPAEGGWFETSWYRTGKPGFEIAEFDLPGGSLRVGVLLCTELMFNERARAYGKGGAELIVSPRASGRTLTSWQTAGAMASLVSGCYLVSSNRAGPCEGGPNFGGIGFAYGPNAGLLAQTSVEDTLALIELDPALSRKQKTEYPCYVTE
jgi:N-carbamoylputrescine amidase